MNVNISLFVHAFRYSRSRIAESYHIAHLVAGYLFGLSFPVILLFSLMCVLMRQSYLQFVVRCCLSISLDPFCQFVCFREI